jgi:hypothetical protein
MLLLKPMKEGVAPSSLLVRTAGERIYLHYIAFKARPEKIFWDYRTDTLMTLTPAAGNTGENEPAGQEIFSGQLARLKAGPKRKLARDKANGLQLSVTNVAVDKEATYLLLDLENKTSIPYQLEYVSFAYKERRSRKSQRRIQPEENLVQPLYQQTLPVVSPHDRELMAYALPLHAGTHKGYLEVVIREASGNRLLSGSIPARKIARSQYLDSTRQTAVLQLQAEGAKGTRQSFHSAPVSQSSILSRKDGR